VGTGSYRSWANIPGSVASTTSHTVSGLANGATHTFRIRARAGLTNGTPSDVVTATAGPRPGEITLSWTDPGNSNITKYQYRQGSGSPLVWGSWTDITNSTATTVSHTVTGLTNRTTYSFRIRAVDGTEQGAQSDQVTATPAPPAPARPRGFLGRSGPLSGQVFLFWNNPNNSDITKWQLRWKKAPGSYGSWMDINVKTGSLTITHTVSGLTNGTEYSFRVRAFAGLTAGAASSTVTATPMAPPTVTIASQGSGSVTEGSDVVFRVTASRAVSANLTVSLRVEDVPNADFVSSTNQGSQSVVIASGSSTADFTLSTVDDTTDEASGSVVIELDSGTGYVVGSSSSVLAGVVDDDATTVTVSIPSVSTGTAPILTATNLWGWATGSRTGNGRIVLSDNDTPGLVFAPTSLTVAEGSSGSYTVKLASEPTGNVTVTVGGASGEVTVDTNSGSPGNQTTLTFTTSNWNTAQPVTVAASLAVSASSPAATVTGWAVFHFLVVKVRLL